MKYCRGCKQDKELSCFTDAGGEIFTRCMECLSYPQTCTKCKEIKPVSDFPINRRKNKFTAYSSWCNQCHRIYASGNKEQWRKYNLKAKYNLSPGDYDEILKSQRNTCAICKTPAVNNKRLHVDHDHSTGEVRGLLCQKCNTALGGFKDKLELIEAAASYLRNSRVLV